LQICTFNKESQVTRQNVSGIEVRDDVKKVSRLVKQLESWFNLEASRDVEEYEQVRKFLLDDANIALMTTTNVVKEPARFEEA
jgi:hypothetical protein